MQLINANPKGAMLLTSVVMFFMVGLVFFPEVNLGLPISHIMIIILMGLLLLLAKIPAYKVFFKLDPIQSIFGILALVAMIVYLIRIPNIDFIKDNYARMTGNRPSGLYPKVALNGILALALFWFAYGFGKFSAPYPGLIKKIIGLIIFLCLVNALANIVGWLVQTGGQISRYNFIPPLVRSAGTSIGYSILGFTLLFATGSYFRFWNGIVRFVILITFFFSIVIIVTRQSQISFLLLFVTYLIFKRRQVTSKSLLIFFLILPIFGFLAFLMASALNFASLFVEAASSDSVDFLVRVAAFDEAWRIFGQFPFFGAGYGMYALYSQLQLFVAGEVVFLASAHNGLASIAGEMGFFGLAIVLLMLFIVLKTVFRAKSQLQTINFYSSFVTSTFAYTVVNIPLMLISNFYLLPPPSEYTYAATTFFAWYSIGVCAGLNRLQAENAVK